MNFITILNSICLRKSLAEYPLDEYKIINFAVGNNDKILILLEKRISSYANDSIYTTFDYKALSFCVNWYSGEVYGHQLIDFNLQTSEYHFIQSLNNGYLLLNSRSERHSDGTADNNALITDRMGAPVNSFCLGDGIGQCIVDAGNNIITGYFDEGVFGNYGWKNPVGSSGIIKWSENGLKLWENKKYAIVDCYAMNIDENDHLWFYYYTDFHLVKTNYSADIVFHPGIAGSDGFLICQKQTSLLFQKGYHEKKAFTIVNIENGFSLPKPADCEICFRNECIDIDHYTFRSSKAVFMDPRQNIYFTNWI